MARKLLPFTRPTEADGGGRHPAVGRPFQRPAVKAVARRRRGPDGVELMRRRVVAKSRALQIFRELYAVSPGHVHVLARLAEQMIERHSREGAC